MSDPTIRVKMSNPKSRNAYIALPGYPMEVTPGVVARTISLDDLIADYHGPVVNLDFDKDARLIGIEVLA